MKKKNILMYAALILAAACALVFSGCPGEPGEDEGVDGRLVASWTNDPQDDKYTAENGLTGLEKTFTIRTDSTFTAYINVIFLSALQGAKIDANQINEKTTPAIAGLATGLTTAAQVESVDDLKWTVTGKLTKIADETYLMAGLTAAGPAGPNMGDSGDLRGVTPAIVGAFATVPVKLQIKDDGGTFTFTGDSSDKTTNAQVDAFFGGAYAKAKETE